MDAVDPETFTAITRVPRSFPRVSAGVRKAQQVGLAPVKINCVLLRGFNDHEIERFAQFSRDENLIVRFIEFMPLEEGRTWKPETVVTMDELVERLNAAVPLSRTLPPRRQQRKKTASLLPSTMDAEKIGIIAPVSRPFMWSTAAASASPPTARSAHASSPRATTISTARCCAEELTTSSPLRISAKLSCERKRVITSANQASKSLRETWFTSADKCNIYPEFEFKEI